MLAVLLRTGLLEWRRRRRLTDPLPNRIIGDTVLRRLPSSGPISRSDSGIRLRSGQGLQSPAMRTPARRRVRSIRVGTELVDGNNAVQPEPRVVWCASVPSTTTEGPELEYP